VGVAIEALLGRVLARLHLQEPDGQDGVLVRVEGERAADVNGAVGLVRVAAVDNAVPRPDSVDEFYVEPEYDAKATEQKLHWTAAGERTAHDSTVEAAGLKHQATELEAVARAHEGVLDYGVSYLAKPFAPADLAAKVRGVLHDGEAPVAPTL
jgi:hypothetical protein